MGTVAAGIVHFNKTRDFSDSLNRILSQVDYDVILGTMGHFKAYHFIGRVVFSYKYGPFRLFDQYRGRVCLYKNYLASHRYWVVGDLLAAVKSVIKISLFENNKFAKLKTIVRGSFRGLLRPYEEQGSHS